MIFMSRRVKQLYFVHMMRCCTESGRGSDRERAGKNTVKYHVKIILHDTDGSNTRDQTELATKTANDNID